MFELTDLAVLLAFCSLPLLIGNHLLLTAKPFSDGTRATGDSFPEQLERRGRWRVYGESVLLVVIVCALGLLLASWAGLEPIRLTNGEIPLRERIWQILKAGVSYGVVAWLVFDLLRVVFFYRHLKTWDEDCRLDNWRPFVGAACFAGVFEELLFRLAILSAIAWGLAIMWPAASGDGLSAVFWIANGGAALAMAASHLSILGAELPKTWFNAAKWISLVFTVSLVLGYVYWEFGFEASVVCHATALLMGWIVSSLVKRWM